MTILQDITELPRTANMATQETNKVDDTKIAAAQAESVYQDDEKQSDITERDYAGAKEKTDPIEIALVRKLDRWIMPTLWVSPLMETARP